MISSSDLVHLLGDLLLNQPSATAEAFSEIVVDSREAQPGSLFVALRGETLDGHQFVDDALRGGASAALVSEASGLRGSAMFVVEDPLFALQEAGTSLARSDGRAGRRDHRERRQDHSPRGDLPAPLKQVPNPSVAAQLQRRHRPAHCLARHRSIR